jgi:hypothetical protein
MSLQALSDPAEEVRLQSLLVRTLDLLVPVDVALQVVEVFVWLLVRQGLSLEVLLDVFKVLDVKLFYVDFLRKLHAQISRVDIRDVHVFVSEIALVL